jgi:hypothetical protein
MKRIGLIILLGFCVTMPAQASEVEKKGYIITNDGDTVHGTIFLRKENGSISSLQFFFMVKFSDSTGAKKTYKPGELKGYGLMFINDTTISHLQSFNDVEMQGPIGKKKESAFLLREVSGAVELYYLFHEENNGFQRSRIPEIYMLIANEPGTPVRIKPKTFKVPLRYKRSDILQFLKDWPETEYSKIHEELSAIEVMTCVATYNDWRKSNIINNQ